MRFKGIFISNSIEKSGSHSHEFWELCMNLEGETINYFNGEQHTVGPGTVFLCPPGGIHSKKAISGRFKDISIALEDTGFFGKVSEYYFEDKNNTFYNLFVTMYDVYHSDFSEKVLVINGLLEALCGIIKSKQENTDVMTPVVEQLKEYIYNNFSNPEFKISDFASCNSYSSDYLRQVFKRQIGVSPLDYLNDLRINNAQKMLLINREPLYRITEIAQFSGFYDVGYFTRMFKKKTGMTPSEYRANNAELENCDDLFPIY